MKKPMDRNDKMFDIILEEAFEKYAKDIANEEPEYEMTEEEIRIMESKEQIIYNKLMKEIDAEKKKKFPIKKVGILVAVLVLGITAVSIGASALRDWWQRTNVSMSGTDLNVDTKKLTFDDYKNIINFENKAEIIVPNWLPECMDLIKINDETDTLNLSYKNGEYWVTITENIYIKSENSKIDTENNNFQTIKGKILDMECSIVEITSERDKKIYTVHWNSNNTNYSLMTNVSEEDFNKILENLRYLED